MDEHADAVHFGNLNHVLSLDFEDSAVVFFEQMSIRERIVPKMQVRKEYPEAALHEPRSVFHLMDTIEFLGTLGVICAVSPATE